MAQKTIKRKVKLSKARAPLSSPLPPEKVEDNKRNLCSWRIGIAAFFLIVLFYTCHPLIFDNSNNLVILDSTEEIIDIPDSSINSYAEKNAICEKKHPSEKPLSEITQPQEKLAEGEFTPAEDAAYIMAALQESADSLPAETSQDEQSYKLYEENLPNNIIDDAEDKKSALPLIHYNKKSIKDINISIQHKPRYFGKQPVIAIVIDDMGVNQRRTKEILSLKASLTSSFLTYSANLTKQINEAKASGHEIMAHVPMEPHKNLYPSADSLTIVMDDEDIKQDFTKMLTKFEGISGINNHMGSKFTENKQKMSDIMSILKQQNLYFLDSKTTSKSVGKAVAKEYGVAYAHRHVFLDNVNDKDYILQQLAITERIAKKNGYAVAIGHPKSQTYEALKVWLPSLKDKNIKLVHMSNIVQVLN